MKKSEKKEGISSKSEANTRPLPSEEMQRFADTDDDPRLPREMPQPEFQENISDEEMHDTELIDDSTDLSDDEIRLLDEAENDRSSDESRFLENESIDDVDEDGEDLNETRGHSWFDTGDDLDIDDKSIMNPDIDSDKE